MANKRAQYLFKKRGIFYFERRVPTDLASYYDTAKITKSLKTRNHMVASKMAVIFSDNLDCYWAGLRSDIFATTYCGKIIPAQKVKHEHQQVNMLEALKSYLKLKEKNNDRRFIRYSERAVDYLITATANKPLEDYTRVDANKFRDFLIKKGLAQASVKRNFEVVRAIFNLISAEQGYELTNPFSKVIIINAKEDKIRPPIPLHQIRELQTLCKSTDDEMRWLIALVSDTGMRLAEACGLLVSDFRLNDEVPHMIIQPHSWRRLKTNGSSRLVPLVGYSLWAAQRVINVQQTGFAFPRYCCETSVKAGSASNALNKWMRPKVEEGCVVHSFRHSFRDRMRSIECPPDIIDQLGGWRTAGVGQQYGSGYDLSVLKKWLSRLE